MLYYFEIIQMTNTKIKMSDAVLFWNYTDDKYKDKNEQYKSAE